MIHLFHLILFSTGLLFASTQDIPAEHPGSDDYSFEFQSETLNINRREVVVFYPKLEEKKALPVIIFGHGQALDAKHYQKSFEHLAKKGVVTIHPQYDTGFFDQQWERMAKDYNVLAEQTLQNMEDKFSASSLIFSGHSKGAYVGLMASALMSDHPLKPDAMVFFAPAGFDRKYLEALPSESPLTLLWGESDTIIKKSMISEIFDKSKASQFKQFIEVQNISDAEAGHFFPLTRRSTFGGSNKVSHLHRFGVWKWLMGAVQDAEENSPLTNPYIYGEQTLSSGEEGLSHVMEKIYDGRKK